MLMLQYIHCKSITILLKDPTAGIIGNIIQVIIIQPIFIIICNIGNNKEKSLFRKISSALTTPLIIMPITGILLNYSQRHINMLQYRDYDILNRF